MDLRVEESVRWEESRRADFGGGKYLRGAGRSALGGQVGLRSCSVWSQVNGKKFQWLPLFVQVAQATIVYPDSTLKREGVTCNHSA